MSGGQKEVKTLLDLNPGYDYHKLSKVEANELAMTEFAKLTALDQKNFAPKNFSFALEDVNVAKNRYGNIFPFDWNVFPNKGTSSHYIGASVVPKVLKVCGGSGSAAKSGVTGASEFPFPHDFLACHAPVSENISSWFEVLKGSGCKMVVMLTSEVEGGILKADAYWPEKIGEEVQLNNQGSSVTLLKEEALDLAGTIIQRELSYRSSSANVDGLSGADAKPYVLRQLQYKQWPDHGVPTKAEGFVSVLKEVQIAATDAPVMVHCSAGIGRTGTLIAAYHGVELAKQGKLVTGSVYTLVHQLKSLRWGMVQRREQYQFIHSVLVHLLSSTPAVPK